MLAVVLLLAISGNLVAILNIGLRNISKRITSLILNIYTQPEHALTHNFLCFKIIDEANSKFDLNLCKEALSINWRKPNLHAQQNHLAITLLL